MTRGGGGAVSALTKKEKSPPPAQNVAFTSVRSMHCNSAAPANELKNDPILF
jgi:hypothetical protein